jgi:hypothetical protein
MSFKPEDYNGQDEHFSLQDAKNFFSALEKGALAEIELSFGVLLSGAEKNIEKFFSKVAADKLTAEAKTQVEESKLTIQDTCAKLKQWFSDGLADIKAKPEEAANKIKTLKEEFSKKWTDARNVIAEKTKYAKSLMPASENKPGINAEEIILKAQGMANLVIPKLKNLFEMSKAAAKGAIKGVKEMEEKKDDSEKK